MQFVFETTYDKSTLPVMAKCLRKTVRKKHSRRSHVFGWIVMALALALSLRPGEDGLTIGVKQVATWAVVLVLFLTLIFEDRLNGYIAGKRMLKGTEKSVAVFDTENTERFVSETEVGKSEFAYEKIVTVAETRDYFVFLLSANHAQIYDKTHLTGGTPEQFGAFIREAAGVDIVFVK